VRNQFAAAMIGATLLLCLVSRANAQGEPLGGQPERGAKQSVKDLGEQVAYQRAFEAVLWATPASAIYRFRVGLLEQPGMADNVITAYSGPLTMAQELITPNQVTPYLGAASDLRNGPVVLEVPAKTGKAVLYGQVVDAWQATIADVGPSGLDKGEGGKYLFLPPGYKDSVPDGLSRDSLHQLSNPFWISLHSAWRRNGRGGTRLQHDT
jgi:hypothetical protein